MEFVTRTINNRIINVRPHATVLQACETAGIEVPRFCYHEKLSVAGNCRRCLVEVYKSPKPVVACARPVVKGRIIHTNTPLVRKAREAVLEFLLINHPLDCPICDQGGECDLQDEALNFGSDRGRYTEFKRSVEDKECGPIIKTIRTRCIHCTRCIRFATEIAGHETFGSFGRGENTEIGTYIHSFIRTELSGNFIDLCPVGALTSKIYAYQARNWELQNSNTIDFFDAVCSDIVVYTRKRTNTQYNKGNLKYITREEILRILPKINGFYSENWISDRTRYAFDGLNYSRLLSPIIQNINTLKGDIIVSSWSEIITYFIKKLYISIKDIGKPRYFIFGTQINLERVYSIRIYAKQRSTNYAFQQGNYSVIISTDIISNYEFNHNINIFSENNFNGAIFIGTNIRFEASILCTRFRREQNRRALSYITIGTFASQRFNQIHQGNTLGILINYLENRISYNKNINSIFVSTNYGFNSIFLGIEILRSRFSNELQRITRKLSKRIFSKTKQNERLGYIHNSVATLAFSHFGLFKSFTSKYNWNQKSIIFSIQNNSKIKSNQNKIKKAYRINLSTHQEINKTSYKRQLPLVSLYERSGTFLTINGNIRKHTKVATPLIKTHSLENIFTALCYQMSKIATYRWRNSLSYFYSELPISFIKNNIFRHNIYSFEFASYIRIVSSPFYRTIHNYYLNDPISKNSPTRGECSLFLGQESNFIIEN